MTAFAVCRHQVWGVACALVTTTLLLTACAPVEPSPSPSPQPVAALHPSFTEGSWLPESYASGLGSVVSINGKFCGVSSDGKIVVTVSEGASGQPDSMIGWDSRTAESLWRLPGTSCNNHPVDGDQILVTSIGASSPTAELRAMSTGTLLATWPLPNPEMSPFIWDLEGNTAIIAGRPQQAGKSIISQITFVDAMTGKPLWKYVSDDASSNVSCTVEGMTPLVLCRTVSRGSEDGWTALFSSQGVPLGPRLAPDAGVAMLTDGIVVAEEDHGTSILDASGTRVGVAAHGLPALTIPDGARLPRQDANNWDGIIGVDAAGNPRLRQGKSGALQSVTSGNEISGAPIAIAASGNVIALFDRDTKGSSARITLVNADGTTIDSRSIDQKLDNASKAETSHGLLLIHGFAPGDGYHRVFIVPPKS